MERIILPNVHMKNESYSYIDGLHAILTNKGWLNCSKAVLGGMTAMAFRFTVNRQLTGESSTAYNWMAEHFVAADLLGLRTTQHAGFQFQPTFPLYRNLAIQDIKQSIRLGIGALIWKDSFIVVTGFDDEKGLLMYSDGSSEQLQTLKYEDFGSNDSPYWYYQLYEGQDELDIYEVYKESMLQAVNKWETHDIMLPRHEYACGRQAYDAIVEALVSGDYDRVGAYETFRSYGAAKRDAAQYMASLKHIWPLCEEIGELYDRVANLFELIVHKTTGAEHSLKSLIIEAQQYEEEAIARLRGMLRESIDNRFEDIGLR